jgi:hypothetical protein
MKRITRNILEQLWRDPANWKLGLNIKIAERRPFP